MFVFSKHLSFHSTLLSFMFWFSLNKFVPLDCHSSILILNMCTGLKYSVSMCVYLSVYLVSHTHTPFILFVYALILRNTRYSRFNQFLFRFNPLLNRSLLANVFDKNVHYCLHSTRVNRVNVLDLQCFGLFFIFYFHFDLHLVLGPLVYRMYAIQLYYFVFIDARW